jgi:hypothetical protein
MRPIFHKCHVTLLTLAALSLFASGTQAQNGNPNPGVIPPDARYHGLTYSEWQARWWQWVFSLPAANNPILPGGNVLQGQTDHVWFLTGVFGTEVRDITIPAGTALFVPIVNTECSTIEPPPFHGDNEAELRACAKAFIDSTSGLACEIDGASLQNLSAYRHQSPLYMFGPLPEDNLLGVPAGTTALSVDDGIYLLLTPLPVGDHTIHFTGTFAELGTIDTTYHITVVSGRKAGG